MYSQKLAVKAQNNSQKLADYIYTNNLTNNITKGITTVDKFLRKK
jgi:hypothetical protein